MQRAGTERKLVTADDRTGALEVAAELASSGAPVAVLPFAHASHVPATGSVVVDIGSRALTPDQAVERLRPYAGVVRGHKIDSTLRGNWLAEVRELANHRRVLMVPSAPALGRTCVDGVVHVHGRALPDGNLRALLPEAHWLPGADAVEAWLRAGAAAGAGVAMCAEWPRDAYPLVVPADVVIVGPAAAIGAALRTPADAPPARLPRRPHGRVLVVCGSASSVARRQIDQLRQCGFEALVVDTPLPSSLGSLSRTVIARRLEQFVHDGNDWRSFDVVVAIGGDTAEALFGDEPCTVGGYATLGVPWSVRQGVLTLTKAGAFGDDTTVVDVLREVVGHNG